jgi:alginate O-acetyltransferase complex protein AlgI
MLFCTQTFLLFFLTVFAVYWALPWHRGRVWLLLAASFVFYCAWSRWLALLVVGTATLDYLLARAIDRLADDRRRRALMWVSVGVNLGVLGFFKYSNFFIAQFNELITWLGAGPAAPHLQLLAPIGISFYTFEAISYTVDVYRRKIPAERNLANFLLFILFFPHLIAGPIVRAGDFLPQTRRRKRWNWLRISVGLQLCLLGMVKKMVIADRMALFVDPVFNSPELYRTSALWLAALAYLIQVYGDFSGYSDLAMGTAHLLGYRLAWNFDLPYLAPNVAEFWRRWHMSLGSWFRDYLFFPLGGSRGGEWRTWRNYLFVMLLCGLWHGAAMHFLVFGLIHGIWLSLARLSRHWCQQRPAVDAWMRGSLGTALRVGTTLTLFMLTLVIFRIPTVGRGLRVLGGMFAGQAGATLPMHASSLAVLAGLVAFGHVAATGGRWKRWLAALPPPVRGLGYAAVAAAALLLAPDVGQAFIYFDF